MGNTASSSQSIKDGVTRRVNKWLTGVEVPSDTTNLAENEKRETILKLANSYAKKGGYEELPHWTPQFMLRTRTTQGEEDKAQDKAQDDAQDNTRGETQDKAEAKPYTLVDCRDLAEQRVSIIPGAVSSTSFDNLEQLHAADKASEKKRTYVCYCTIGYRSGLFATKLRDLGIDAVNMEGSILLWTHDGGELVKGPASTVDRNDDGIDDGNDIGNGSTRDPTNRLHVYGKLWDLAPDHITTVMGTEEPYTILTESRPDHS